MKSDLEKYLKDGKVSAYPSKLPNKLLVLEYLASKFELGKDYTEKQVTDTLWDWHTFQDPALLRRELIDLGFFERERDGSRYWRKERSTHES